MAGRGGKVGRQAGKEEGGEREGKVYDPLTIIRFLHLTKYELFVNICGLC